MEKKIITKEAILSANTYVGTMAKDKFVKDNVTACLEAISVNAGDDTPMPPMYKENAEIKGRILMGALLSMYLKDTGFIPVEDTTCTLSADDYDRYAGSHILNQLERFKSDKETRDIVFDLLQDYQDLNKRMNVEIYAYLTIMNDPATRLIATINAQSTPEAVKQAIEGIKDLEKQFKEYGTAREDHSVIEEEK